MQVMVVLCGHIWRQIRHRSNHVGELLGQRWTLPGRFFDRLNEDFCAVRQVRRFLENHDTVFHFSTVYHDPVAPKFRLNSTKHAN